MSFFNEKKIFIEGNYETPCFIADLKRVFYLVSSILHIVIMTDRVIKTQWENWEPNGVKVVGGDQVPGQHKLPELIVNWSFKREKDKVTMKD